MTIKDLLVSSPLPLLETEIIIAYQIGKDRSFLQGFPETQLSKLKIKQIKHSINLREKNTPLAYILGFKEFYGRKFKVNKHVLIPRPESESLIEKALELFGKKSKINILDVGTGSGCLAVTLALEFPFSTITATDISNKALTVAQRNTKFHGLTKRITFFQENLVPPNDQTFNLVVANLPYIPTKNYLKLPSEIKNFEPRTALESGVGKTTLYKQLFSNLEGRLTGDGVILYELDGKVFIKKPIP